MQTSTLLQSLPVGIGATLVLDAWLILLKQLGVPTLNFALVGRWVAHAVRGRIFQPAIARAAPVRGELALGWFAHYAIGIAFAAVLIGVQGSSWTQEPSLLPALIVGICTAAAPLFVMQPAMGGGFAASKTPTPLKNCIRSLVNHTVFGFGLYVSAVIADSLLRQTS
jgi:hypothetical protein